MKKFLLTAIAASLIASPILAAAPADAAQRRQTTVVRHEPGYTVVTKRTVTRKPVHRNWKRGERFDYRYARNYRVVTNYRSYHRLYAPPRGYHWVRSGNDAVLVAITGGLIGAVVAGAFN